MRKSLQFRILLSFALLTLVTGFQNCGSSAQFSSAVNSKVGDSDFDNGKVVSPAVFGVAGKTYKVIRFTGYSGCADRDVTPDTACTMALQMFDAKFEHTVTFGADGSLDVAAACNHMSGKYALNDKGGIRVGELMSTLMGCEGVHEEELLGHRLVHARSLTKSSENELVLRTNQSSEILLRLVEN
jgi:hypothetical protein